MRALLILVFLFCSNPTWAFTDNGIRFMEPPVHASARILNGLREFWELAFLSLPMRTSETGVIFYQRKPSNNGEQDFRANSNCPADYFRADFQREETEGFVKDIVVLSCNGRSHMMWLERPRSELVMTPIEFLHFQWAKQENLKKLTRFTFYDERENSLLQYWKEDDQERMFVEQEVGSRHGSIEVAFKKDGNTYFFDTFLKLAGRTHLDLSLIQTEVPGALPVRRFFLNDSRSSYDNFVQAYDGQLRFYLEFLISGSLR